MAPAVADDRVSTASLKVRKRKRNKKCQWLRRNWFLLLLILCTIGGYVLGLLLRPYNLSNRVATLIGFPGDLVLRAFLMIIVPLLFCSLVLGVSSLRKGGDARMVVITIGLFLGLSSFASIMGATVGHLVHPGQKITGKTDLEQTTMSGRKGVILDSMLDLLRNAMPDNIIEATFTKEYTHVELVETENDVGNSTAILYNKSIRKKSGINFMGLLMFGVLFGSALAASGEKGEQLHQVIVQLNGVIMSIMNYYLNLLPVGMFFWMCKEGLQSTSPELLLGYLGVFLATAFGCIAFHQLVLLPSLYVIIVRKNPVTFHLNMLPAILTAFGTCSSAITLPATIRCAEEVNKINRCVTRFVLPLGMVVHMNGITFYATLASIFLAQLEGVTIGPGETTVLCLTTLLLGIAAPATVGGGNPVFLLTAMAAAGIEKPQFISLVLSVDWLMERFRTVMNITADSYVAALVERLCRGKLPEDDEQDSIEFVSPVIDGYNHKTKVLPTNTCKHCGNPLDTA